MATPNWPGVTSEHKTKDKPWALLGVALNQKLATTKKLVCFFLVSGSMVSLWKENIVTENLMEHIASNRHVEMGTFRSVPELSNSDLWGLSLLCSRIWGICHLGSACARTLCFLIISFHSKIVVMVKMKLVTFGSWTAFEDALLQESGRPPSTPYHFRVRFPIQDKITCWNEFITKQLQ